MVSCKKEGRVEWSCSVHCDCKVKVAAVALFGETDCCLALTRGGNCKKTELSFEGTKPAVL